MRFLDAKEAVKEMRKHGFDIVRCIDCKRSRQYEDKDGEIKTYCWRLEGYVESDGFCSHGIHIEKDKCYECPIAEEYNLEDDDSPCQNCGASMDEAEPEDTYCTEENCPIFNRDLSCERCNR